MKTELGTFFAAFPNATIWSNTIDGQGYYGLHGQPGAGEDRRGRDRGEAAEHYREHA